MNRIIDKRQAICGIVWIIAIGIILSLWPFRLVKETIISDTNKQIVAESEEITQDYVVKQMFIAQYDRLKNISVYFSDGTVGEYFNFVLYDAAMNVIMQQITTTEDMESIPGYCTVQVNIDTEVGKEYYFLIQGLESAASFRVAYENSADSGNIYNGTLYYGNVEDTDHSMLAEYHYEVPLRKGRTLACDVIVLAFAVIVTWFTGQYYKKHPEKNKLITVECAFKAVANPVIVIIGLGSMAAVWPCRLFTDDVVSILFYESGILLLGIILLYGVNHNRTGYATDRTLWRFWQDKWQDYLQAAMFAGAFWACCNYMNGLYDIHHTVAYRQMLIFLALAVIVTYKKKELFHPVNFVYIVIAAVVGYVYYTKTVSALETPGELEIQVVRLTAWVGILAGLIVINTVCLLIRRQIGGLSFGYAALVAVFFALIIIYRNTRGWPIYLVCAFTFFYLRMGAWERKAHLLNNICNGVLFHFVMMIIYCLLHRPYMFYIYYRYPFIFHTVTISAVYLAMVVCAAMVKFLDVYRREARLAGMYKELILLGVSSAYLVFTLSRTGYLAVAAMAVIVIPVVCASLKKWWKSMLQCVGIMFLAVILCFPVTFTAQRLVPSVAADPILHEIEWLPAVVEHGRVPDSNYYMTIQRFVQVFQMKIFGVPEEECIEVENHVVRREEKHGILSPLFSDEGKILLASSEDMAAEPQEEESDQEEEDSYANGRFQIFRVYYKNLNKFGHEDMGIMQPNGEFIVHAHNIYLQVAYDHGIYVGIVFILFGVGTLVQAFLYYRKRKADTACAVLPLAMLILFAAAGLTEWIFHPCSSICCCLLLTLGPLIFDNRKKA